MKVKVESLFGEQFDEYYDDEEEVEVINENKDKPKESRELTREMLEELGIKVEFDKEGNPTIWRWGKCGNSHSKSWHKVTQSQSNRDGYLCTQFIHNGIYSKLMVHRIVYAWVHGKCSKGYHIDHIDGNRQNNKPSNLQELTPQDNIAKRGAPQAVEECKALRERVKYLESLLDKEGIDYDKERIKQ